MTSEDPVDAIRIAVTDIQTKWATTLTARHVLREHKPLSTQMQNVLAYIRAVHLETGETPSLVEIGERFAFSAARARQIVMALRGRGEVGYQEQRPRPIRLYLTPVDIEWIDLYAVLSPRQRNIAGSIFHMRAMANRGRRKLV